MHDWLGQTPEAAQDYVARHGLDEVECLIADIPGIARGKAMPATKFTAQARFHLPDTIFYQTITGRWPEHDDLGYTEPDMVLVPDYSTATAAPWTADGTLQIIHDVHDRKGTPVPVAPRNVLRRVLDLYHAEGWHPVVAPEMEFYLTSRNVDPGQEITPMVGRSGRAAAAQQAYSIAAVDEYGPIVDDIYDFAEAQGLEIDGITQEGGPGQLEINLRHGDPLRLADEVFFFKRLIREAALRHDCFATFMAKPIEGSPGSAMHIHQSVMNAEGANIFAGPQGGETDAFYHFIGGMQRYMPAATILMAPYVNSFRRFVRDHAAPINLEWGHDNRTAGIRIPLSETNARRIENRIGGMDCNPYLGIAASLACGYLGMKHGIAPHDACKGDAYDNDHDGVPEGMFYALELFEDCPELHEILNPTFSHIYALVKRSEYEEFLQVISPWEREHLLLNV